MIIVGLAIATCEHHAAALVVDGQVLGAAEEERFNGIKHYGWAPANRSGDNLINSPDLKYEQAVCHHALRWVLAEHGISMADVDYFVLNGLPHRFLGERRPVVEGNMVYIPHHLAHAALGARLSPHERCQVLSIDGRGEYETAAWFDYRDNVLTRKAEVAAGEGRSFGGAYETITRVLGFGPHGQGQTMALAAFGHGDSLALAEGYDVKGFQRVLLDERILQVLAEARIQPRSVPASPASPEAVSLAADIQASTETAMKHLIQESVSSGAEGRLAIVGGVALNCRANALMRSELGLDVWVPSAPHDAGTALGAALEAAFLLGEPAPNPLQHAGLGPNAGPQACEQALQQAGFKVSLRGDAVVAGAVERLMDGKVLGWVEGRLEFGPRALGHRSIVAHPGHPLSKSRVNAIKGRQAWRPFGPSVLVEHAEDWFEDPGFGPFMTSTVRVKRERHEKVSAILHVDGTTRPQRVDAHANRGWRKLIESFYAASGLPMVLNTSFNGRGEPIVKGPQEAVDAALRLGLDALVLGDNLVDLPGEARRHSPSRTLSGS